MTADQPSMATPRVAAGVLFRNRDCDVLLVKPTYKDGWDLPGGYVEPGESPKQAAERELQEELGISPQIGRLLVIDWAPHPAEGDKLLFVFDGGLPVIGEIFYQRGEIETARFWNLHDLPRALPRRLLRRVISALEFSNDAYLEGGVRITPNLSSPATT